jgi:ATP-binding cassette, subfamily C (CFTR/MRP), member 1
MAMIMVIQVLWMASNSASNLWMAHWSERAEEIASGKSDFGNDFYIGIYAAIAVVYATLAFIRALALAFSYPKMSLLIHESMISNLLFSSLTDFFDRVPLGRIFNRLSKDMNSVDASLPNFFNSTLVFVFMLASNLTVILIIAPIEVFLPTIVVYLFCCHILRGYVVKPLRQLTRMEGVTKSPIVSCFTEILSGVTTIRCYSVKDMFFHKNCEKINENKKPIMVKKATEVWFTFRLTIVAFIINLISLGYILFFASKKANATVASAQAGLLLLCTLALDEVMYFLYVNLNAFENELISIERCEAFMNL